MTRFCTDIGKPTAMVLVAVLLCACAGTPREPEATAWTPDAAWWRAAIASGGTLTAPDGGTRFVSARHAKNLFEVSGEIRTQSRIDARIELSDEASLNAWARDTGGARRIVLTLAFLHAIGGDRDALANSLGHEAAHLHFAHGATRRARGRFVVGSTDAIAGITAVDLSFSRFEEREADIQGMDWAVAAGYSPCGAVRTLRILQAQDDAGDGFLATHPDDGERIARAQALAKKLGGKGC